VHRWLAAAADPAVGAELEGVYGYVGAHVESRGPSCWASGRCCSFEKSGHLLYTTGLETAYTVSRVRATSPSHRLTVSRSHPGCPFQSANLCGVHAVRPLGCRVYFCDRSAQEWQRELSERAIAQVRAVHDRHGIEYRYGEWRSMLGLFFDRPREA
jgi:Fe-S-cluster containining protein